MGRRESSYKVRRRDDRVRVGSLIEPVAPVWAIRMNMRTARVLGVDDVWFSDHTKSAFPAAAWNVRFSPMARFVSSLDAYLDPTVALARWARPRGPVMGVAVTDVVRRSPADLARAWMSLHHLSRGKVVLGIGSGEYENTVPYGLTLEPRAGRLADALTALRAAWAAPDELLTHTGPFHDWHAARFGLPPLDGTTPPVWVAAQGPRACRIAGQHGDGWMFILNDTTTSWHTAATHFARGAQDAGRDPETLHRSVLLAPLLAPDQRVLDELCRAPFIQAMALVMPGASWTAAGATHPLGADNPGYSQVDPAVFEGERFAEYSKHVTPELVRALMPSGTAADVERWLDPYLDAGLNHILFYAFASAVKPTLAAAGLREQRRLISKLKKRRPGPLAVG
ncbi:LLM class flavin-dependent oxidoreductase [Nocardia colli]|uniref:LLM class flavin-dependent oxidoreductase n=2 Tax=Nocardia colli TaxID=2545717 RepID=A0A5N0EJU6_9NOCA|nr:LLM class flavin-dependent oxidoreductase [Nocardia colli]